MLKFFLDLASTVEQHLNISANVTHDGLQIEPCETERGEETYIDEEEEEEEEESTVLEVGLSLAECGGSDYISSSSAFSPLTNFFTEKSEEFDDSEDAEEVIAKYDEGFLLMLDSMPPHRNGNCDWASEVFPNGIEVDEFYATLRWHFTWIANEKCFTLSTYSCSLAEPYTELYVHSENGGIKEHGSLKFHPITIDFESLNCDSTLPQVVALRLKSYCTAFLAVSCGPNIAERRIMRSALPNEGRPNVNSQGRAYHPKSIFFADERTGRRVDESEELNREEEEEEEEENPQITSQIRQQLQPIVVELSPLLVMYCQGITFSDLTSLEVGHVTQDNQSDLVHKSSTLTPKSKKSKSADPSRSDSDVTVIGTEESDSELAPTAPFEPRIALQNDHISNLSHPHVILRRTFRLAILLNALTSPIERVAKSLDYHRDSHYGTSIAMPFALWQLIKTHVPNQMAAWDLPDLVPKAICFPAVSAPIECTSVLDFTAEVFVTSFIPRLHYSHFVPLSP